jgi:hypothetical protein
MPTELLAAIEEFRARVESARIFVDAAMLYDAPVSVADLCALGELLVSASSWADRAMRSA